MSYTESANPVWGLPPPLLGNTPDPNAPLMFTDDNRPTPEESKHLTDLSETIGQLFKLPRRRCSEKPKILGSLKLGLVCHITDRVF